VILLTPKEKKHLRGIAHHLNPVVTLGDKGVTDAVVTETERALADHELIKARLNILDRDSRKSEGNALAERTGATVVQVIGKVWVLYRHNPDADPRLSNVTRYAG
jgi:RNA-binding protein